MSITVGPNSQNWRDHKELIAITPISIPSTSHHLFSYAIKIKLLTQLLVLSQIENFKPGSLKIYKNCKVLDNIMSFVLAGTRRDIGYLAAASQFGS